MTSELFHPLDDILSLPAMTSQLPFSFIEHELLSLPARLGGLGSLFHLFTFPHLFCLQVVLLLL